MHKIQDEIEEQARVVEQEQAKLRALIARLEAMQGDGDGGDGNTQDGDGGATDGASAGAEAPAAEAAGGGGGGAPAALLDQAHFNGASTKRHANILTQASNTLAPLDTRIQ